MDDQTTIIEAARAYLARGWCVVPIRAREKRPTVDRWQELRLAEDHLDAHFQRGSNIGVILGAPSGWLVDVDLDSPEALQLADTFLPHTDAVSGRPGAPASHRWYIAQGAPFVQHRYADRKPIVEMRSTGGQTVVWPSIHPSGEQYGRIEGQPAVVDAAQLTAAVEELAKACREMRGEALPSSRQEAAHGLQDASSSALGGDRTEHGGPGGARSTAGPHAAPDEHDAGGTGAAQPARARGGASSQHHASVGNHLDLERRAIAYLQALPPAISGAGGHPATYRAATALVHGFALEPQHALQLLLAHYNPRCEPPWSVKELDHKVQDAASKGHARPRGYLRDAERAEEQLARTADISGILRQGVGQSGAASPAVVHSGAPSLDPDNFSVDDARDPGPFPERLLAVPGFIAQVMAYDMATAHKPQPVLSLAGAIALQAVLCGRKVRDVRGNRTNLQIVGVAEAGAGKDNTRKSIKKILLGAGLSALDGNEDLASDSALISALVISPASIFLFDEFGRFLRTAADPRKNPHLFNIITAFMKLYSSADVMFKAKGYADAKQNKVVDQPCCVVYGTSVPSHFLNSLTVDSLTDGFVGRLLIFESESMGVRRWAEALAPPEAILQEARWWGSFEPGGNLGRVSTAGAEPRLVPTTPEAAAVFERLAAFVDAQPKGLGRSLWARAEQKACQLALVHACSARAEEPVIGPEAAEWACDVSAYLTRRMIWLAHTWVADGEFDRRQKDVMRMIRAAGGRITRNELTRKLHRMTSRERTDLIHNLIETRQLAVIEEPTATCQRTVYVAS